MFVCIDSPSPVTKRVVEVLFTSEKLKTLYSTHRDLTKRWGKEGADKITLRLVQLEAAPTLAVLRNLPGRCHELAGDRTGSLAIDVHQPHRLIFTPTASPPPSKPDGGLDWEQVDSVTIIEIIDYH